MAIIQHKTIVEYDLGDREIGQFSMAVNAKSFRIVLDGLYSNKIRAVLRELSTNAFDSHVEAGIPDTPFDIRLPTVLEPTFAIRDYGVSLSHDNVMNLYPRVFESTKDKTNTQVGSFGLGSKSPFAYTDSFTVRAWLDGELRLYVAFIPKEGIPSITLMHSEPSDEPRGLEVSFAVQPRHFYEFSQEATYVALGFDTPPNGLNHQPPQPVLTRGAWKIYEGVNLPSFSIRMGCVIYPIQDNNLSLERLVPAYKRVVYDVPIGSVDPAANRESLSFTDRSIAAIREAHEDCKAEISEYIAELLASSRNTLEAERAYLKIDDLFLFRATIPWGRPGNHLSGYVKFDLTDEKDPLPRDSDGTLRNSFHVDQIENLIFLIDRTDEKVLRRKLRTKQWFRSYRGYRLVNPTGTQLERLVRRLGLRPDQLVSIHNIDDVDIVHKAAAPGEKYLQGVYERTDHYGYAERVRELDLVTRGHYWVGVQRNSTNAWVLTHDFERKTVDDLHYWGSLAKVLGMPFVKFYTLTPTAMKRLDPDPTRRFDAAIVETIENYPNLKLIARARAIQRELYRTFPSDMMSEMFGIDKVFFEKGRNGPLSNFAVDKFVEARYGSVYAAAKAECNRVRRKYPMLFGDATRQDHLEYIKYRNEILNNTNEGD